MTVARTTQHVIEVLASYTSAVRQTQYAVETLASYTPEARTTQYAVETLYSEITEPSFVLPSIMRRKRRAIYDR